MNFSLVLADIASNVCTLNQTKAEEEEPTEGKRKFRGGAVTTIELCCRALP